MLTVRDLKARGFLTPTQAAKRLGVVRSYIHVLADTGRLPCVRLSDGTGIRLIPQDAVEAMKEQRDRKVAEEPRRNKRRK